MSTLINATKPDFVLTFFLARQNELTAPDAIRQLAKSFKKAVFLVSSPYMAKDSIKKYKNIRILESPEDLELLLYKL